MRPSPGSKLSSGNKIRVLTHRLMTRRASTVWLNSKSNTGAEDLAGAAARNICMAEERSNLNFSRSFCQIETQLGARVDMILILILTKGYPCSFTELGADVQNKPNFLRNILVNTKIQKSEDFYVLMPSPGLKLSSDNQNRVLTHSVER